MAAVLRLEDNLEGVLTLSSLTGVVESRPFRSCARIGVYLSSCLRVYLDSRLGLVFSVGTCVCQILWWCYSLRLFVRGLACTWSSVFVCTRIAGLVSVAFVESLPLLE